MIWNAMVIENHERLEKLLTYCKAVTDESFLFAAIIKECPDCVKCLLPYIDYDLCRSVDPFNGNTPLHAACNHYNQTNMDIIEMLLAKEPKLLNTCNFELETPLFLAVSKENFQLVRYLVENGADTNIFDNRGYTPIKLALLYRCNLDIIMYLLNCPNNPKNQDSYNEFNMGLWKELEFRKLEVKVKIIYFKKLFDYLNPRLHGIEEYKLEDILPIAIATPSLVPFFLESDIIKYMKNRHLIHDIQRYFGLKVNLLFILLHQNFDMRLFAFLEPDKFCYPFYDNLQLMARIAIDSGNPKMLNIFLAYMEKTKFFFNLNILWLAEIPELVCRLLRLDCRENLSFFQKFISLQISMNITAKRLISVLRISKCKDHRPMANEILPYTCPNILKDPKTMNFLDEIYPNIIEKPINLKNLCRNVLRTTIYDKILQSYPEKLNKSMQKEIEIKFQRCVSELELPNVLLNYLKCIFIE